MSEPLDSQRESALHLIRELTKARSSDEMFEAFQRAVQEFAAGCYISLWYRDVETSTLLLVSECGVEFGGTVRPQHNELRIGHGIAGTAALDGAPVRVHRGSSEWSRAAAPVFVRVEQLVEIIVVPFEGEDPAVDASGVVLVGLREGQEGLCNFQMLEGLARDTLTSVVRWIGQRSNQLLPQLLTAVRSIQDEKDLIRVGLESLCVEFRCSYGIAVVDSPAGEALSVYEFGDGNVFEPTASNLSHEFLHQLPKSVRLYRAVDPRRLHEVGIKRATLRSLIPLLPESIDPFCHGIAACIPSARDGSDNNAGLVLLLRHPEELGFLPEELAVLVGVANYLGSLVGLTRREKFRSRVVTATQEVAVEADLDLATVSLFLGADDVLGVRQGSIFFRDEMGDWEERSYGHNTSSDWHRIDELLAAADNTSSKLSIRFSDSERRVLNLSGGSEISVPIKSQGRFVGALVLLLNHSRATLREDEAEYLKLLAAQAGLTYSVARLTRSEERFRELLNRINNTESANLLSLGLSHEMKNHLGAFKEDFTSVKDLSDALDSGKADLRAAIISMRAISKNGLTSVDRVTELALAIGSVFDGSNPGISDGRRAPIYLNDIVRLYARGLKVAASSRRQTISLSELTSSLDRPNNEGIGHPLVSTVFLTVKVGQVLSNLVTNALQASPDRGKVVVRTKYGDSAAILEVEDFGRGMTDQEKSRLYEPFYSTKGGFGLGMYIVRMICRDIGAEITFTSKPGAGTTFVVSLPLER